MITKLVIYILLMEAHMSNEIQTENSIQITSEAINELVRLNVSKDEFLRVSLISGGCSGLTYQLDTDTVVTPFDVVLYEDETIRVVTDRSSDQYLQGLHIDYSSDLIDVGFRFTNPNAVHTCGCGNSMSV